MFVVCCTVSWLIAGAPGQCRVFSPWPGYPSLHEVSACDHYEGYKDLLENPHCVSYNTVLTTTMRIFLLSLFIAFFSFFIDIDASPLQRVRSLYKTTTVHFKVSGLCPRIKFWGEKQETILQCFYWVWKEKIRSGCGK